LAQPRGGGLPVGEALGGIAIADLPEIEAAARGDLGRADHRGAVVGEQIGERPRRREGVQVIAAGELTGGVYRDPVPDAGENVLQGAPGRAVIEDLLPGDDGQAPAGGAGAQAGLLHGFLGLAVPGGERVEAVAEGLAQGAADGRRWFVLGGEQAALAAPEGQQPLGVCTDVGPIEATLTFGCPPPPQGDQPTQPGIARAIHGQQDERRAIEQRQFGADEEIEA
jgi:hypothetical protein